MRVNTLENIACHGSHLDGEYALGDQLPGPGADDSDAQNPFTFRVDEHLRQPVRDVQCHGPATCGPRESQNLVRDVALLGVDLRQPRPGDFRIGKDHRRDGARVPLGRFAEDDFHGHAGLGSRLVRQSRFFAHVADGEDVRHVRTALFVDRDVATIRCGHAGFIEAEVGRVGATADRNEHAVEGHRRGHVFAFERRHDPCGCRGDARDFRIHVDVRKFTAQLGF